MAEIDYELAVGDPREAPKGKVPWIDDNGHVLGDSTFVIDYLKQKYGDPLDGRLTTQQQATGHVIQKMLEDSVLDGACDQPLNKPMLDNADLTRWRNLLLPLTLYKSG